MDMERAIFCCFSATQRCFGADLFCELKSSQESDICGGNQHSNKESHKPKHHYPQNIMIHRLLRMIVDKIYSLKSSFSLAHSISYGTKNPL